MTPGPAEFERYEFLKADEALFGLAEDERLELRELAQSFPDEDLEDMERTAAAAHSFMLESETRVQSIPDQLKQELKLQAREHFATAKRTAPTTKQPAARAWQSSWPWMVTALSLAAVVVMSFTGEPRQLTPLEARAQLLASAPDLVQANWESGTTPISGVEGDVVWSEVQQAGFMRFTGLPLNSPTKEQYQLWIFSKNQSPERPIDGGVFDVTKRGRIVVPIDAKLAADGVYMFAVTIEKPGGVVVSSRERLPLLAKIENRVN